MRNYLLPRRVFLPILAIATSLAGTSTFLNQSPAVSQSGGMPIDLGTYCARHNSDATSIQVVNVDNTSEGWRCRVTSLPPRREITDRGINMEQACNEQYHNLFQQGHARRVDTTPGGWKCFYNLNREAS